MGLGAALFGTACRTPPATSSQPLVPTSFFVSGIAAFIADVKTVALAPTDGSKKSGHPADGSTAIVATANGQPDIVSNGGSIVDVQATAPFNKILVSLSNSGAVIDGFWEVDLPAATTDQTILVRFLPGLPSPAFDLHFQVVSAAGATSAPSVIAETVATAVSSLTPQIIASFSPNPVPFENGARCTMTTQLGCLWEFKVILQEFNGVAVNTATLNETYTFANGLVVTGSAPIEIPGAGIGTVVRTVACGTATTSCAPPDELAGGTYTYTVTGTDANGNAFSFTGGTLTLNGR